MFRLAEYINQSIRGLDNAGKTTVVKCVMNEDVNDVSPTLGFIIKTVEFEGLVRHFAPFPSSPRRRPYMKLICKCWFRYKLNICTCNTHGAGQ